ncbi:MAG: hypothetical protein JWR73_1160, partial [Tardiphaga sp.]|nr:hypothetical protein [Tardiphaga sp.]
LRVSRQGHGRVRLSLMRTDLKRDDPKPPRWSQRLIWFVVLWLGGLGAVSALAYVLRLWIAPR